MTNRRTHFAVTTTQADIFMANEIPSGRIDTGGLCFTWFYDSFILFTSFMIN